MGYQIAFLGLGVMGSAMAANLARDCCSVVGWNCAGDRLIKVKPNHIPKIP